jgi:ABC-2 type transport system ATP-binding protein
MLEVRGLTKRYSRVPVVHGVSFEARPGEVTGYLGPNGAGKSTTVKMLTGLIHPSAGEICYRGVPVHVDLVGYKRRVGYVPEDPHLYPYMSGREYLQLVGRLRCISEKALNSKIDDLLALFGLARHGNAALTSYSKGMRQKVLLASALLHNPEVLILDEPLSGLDVTSTLVVRSLIQALAREGRCVLFSSHILEVVEKVCSKVVILHRGRIVADDSVERLRSLMDLPSLEHVFASLVIQEDTERTALDIVEVVKR